MSKKKPGPDQPRSWAIALAACVINTLLSGISRVNGMFYVAMIDTYGVSRFEANLPFTLRNILRNLFGPLVGAIGQRYGPRDVSVVGGIFASCGIALCYLAPNIIWVSFLWGGIHGFGVALGNTLFQVVISQYFVKYRATATGIALSGACVGSFIFPVLLELMFNHYGLAGSFLLTGGMIMHCIPAAIMLIEPPWLKYAATSPPSSKNTSSKKPKLSIIAEDTTIASHQKDACDLGSDETKNISLLDVKKLSMEKIDSTIPEYKTQEHASNFNEKNGCDNPSFRDLKTEPKEASDKQLTEGTRLRGTSLSELSVSMPSNVEESHQESSILKGIVKVCCDPMFHMISLSLASFAMMFDPSITVIVDYIIDKGLEEEIAKYLISVMSLGDLVGRLCFGWVTDRNYLSIPKFMMLLHLIQGVCFLVIPFSYSYEVLVMLVVVYGMGAGAILVMYPILVAKYLTSVQSLAIGFIAFFTGIVSFSVPPLIGYFRDNIGSYDGMFLITGALSIVTGVLWLFEPLLLKLKKKMKRTFHRSSLIVN